MEEDVGEGSDAWEAAQNILKAINFGGLLQLSNEDGKVTRGDPSIAPTSQLRTVPLPLVSTA
jgi:hypothetical protein